MDSDSLLNNSAAADFPFFIKGRQDVVFIHIPKTGGTSIRRSLGFNPINKNGNVRKHNEVKRVIDLLGEEKWQQVYKFAFVRNPWDRLLSFYHFRLRKNRIPGIEHQQSFKKWATHRMEIRDPNSDNVFNVQPQLDWLKDKDGNIQMDFIGRFEHLERDFNQLLSSLSLSSDLMHINNNPKKLDYREHYDSELKKQLARFYEKDIDYFKYTF